jgi:mannonate dehydratase
MKFAMCLETEPNVKWIHAKQMGVDHAVILGHPNGEWPLWDYRTMARLKKRYEDAGLTPLAIEGLISWDNMRLATSERDAEIEQLAAIIRNMGALEIPVLCYSWMAHFTWVRTSTTTRARGGALTTSYDHELLQRDPEANRLRVTEEQLWESYEYFLRKLVPVAEKAKVRLSLHPDDPPLSPVMGVGRIFGKPENFDRAMQMMESEANAITFCQANFSLMNGPERVPELIRHYGKRIAFVHFRDVRGEPTKFVETFHDEGHTNMFEAMRAYRDIGFSGPIRPDHAPAMEGDPNTRPGYEALGRLFAIGYMKGLLEGVDAMRRAQAR